MLVVWRLPDTIVTVLHLSKANRKMRVGTRPHAGAGANNREGDTKPSCFREGETFSARSLARLALATPELAHQQQGESDDEKRPTVSGGSSTH